MQYKKNEWLLFCFGWVIVFATTIVFWFNDDPEIPIPFTPPNIAFVSALFVAFLVGLYCLQRAQNISQQALKQRYQNIGFIVCMLSFCALASIVYYMILGLLFAMLLSTMVSYLRPSWIWMLAVSVPLYAGLYDVYCKEIPFYFTTKLLFVFFNCMVVQFRFYAESEKSAKENSNRLLRELQATQSLLASTAKRDERLRIARDLHDSMGHHLTALKLQLELASHLSGNEAKDKVQEAKGLSEQLLNQVRHNVSEFRNVSDIELVNALQKLVEGIPELDVDFIYDCDEKRLTTRQAEALFRCAQESVTNVLKHSDAEKCSLHLDELEDSIVLTVQDDGTNNAEFVRGSGTKGMQERASMLDGNVEFTPTEHGFKVVMTLPLNLVH